MLIHLVGILRKSRINLSKPSRVLRKSSINLSKFIKYRTNKLVVLAKPVDHENVIGKIFDGLDDDYKTIADIVQNHENPILLDELHEKFIIQGLTLKHLQSDHSSFLVTANMACGHPANVHRRRTTAPSIVIMLSAPRHHSDTRCRPPLNASLARTLVGAKAVAPLVT